MEPVEIGGIGGLFFRSRHFVTFGRLWYFQWQKKVFLPLPKRSLSTTLKDVHTVAKMKLFVLCDCVVHKETLSGDRIMSIFCTVDDKHIPLYRIMWVASVPHFCGEEDCLAEGKYEVRLEQGEAVWAKIEERDEALEALDRWQGGLETPGEDWEA
jgi:hypothetical protein